MSSFLPTTGLYYLMISQSRYSWCAVSVFCIPLCSWVVAGGTKWEFGNWDQEPKVSRKPEVRSWIDV